VGGIFSALAAGPSAFAVGSMANGTVGRVHFLAGYRRGLLDRDVLDDRFWLILRLVLRGERYKRNTIRAINIDNQFL
jgi:hypothetical protein